MSDINNTPIDNKYTGNYDRFEHEQQIMSCWQICDDLEVLNEGVLEKDMTPDQVSNVLSGLKQLYELKFEKLFSTFEKSIKPDPID